MRGTLQFRMVSQLLKPTSKVPLDTLYLKLSSDNIVLTLANSHDFNTHLLEEN